MLELAVGVGFVVVAVAVLVLFAWRVLRIDVTEVKGKRKGEPREFLSDEEIDELLLSDGEKED